VVELGLELSWGLGSGLSGEPLFQCLVEPFDLAAGLRVIRAGVPETDAAALRVASKTTRPPRRERPVNTAPLSDSMLAGSHGWQRLCGSCRRRRGL
jgi:hypothetical protein